METIYNYIQAYGIPFCINYTIVIVLQWCIQLAIMAILGKYTDMLKNNKLTRIRKNILNHKINGSLITIDELRQISELRNHVYYTSANVTISNITITNRLVEILMLCDNCGIDIDKEIENYVSEHRDKQLEKILN